MKATITYRVGRIPNPWNKERRAAGEETWCLIKVTTPDYGDILEDPVALFNLDSEAVAFQGHLISVDPKETTLKVDPLLKEAGLLRKRGI
jgi:hypothetical protein